MCILYKSNMYICKSMCIHKFFFYGQERNVCVIWNKKWQMRLEDIEKYGKHLYIRRSIKNICMLNFMGDLGDNQNMNIWLSNIFTSIYGNWLCDNHSPSATHHRHNVQSFLCFKNIYENISLLQINFALT